MERTRSRPMKQPGATLTQLTVPTEVLRLHSAQRQPFNPRDVGVVGVDDRWNPSQMLHHLSPGAQQPEELLLEGVPFLLARAQVRRVVTQDLQLTFVVRALAHHSADSVARRVGRELKRAASRRLILQPLVGGRDRRKLVRYGEQVILKNQLLETIDRLLLLLVRREHRVRLEQLSERRRNTAISRPSVSLDVVSRTQEGLQILKGVHGRPLPDGANDRGVRAPPVPTHDFAHQLHLSLGNLELGDAEAQGERRRCVKGSD